MENWVLYKSVAYLRGRGASFGGSLLPPQALADRVFSIQIDPINTPQSDGVDHGIELFAEGSLDHVYIGPRVELLQEKDLTKLLQDASAKLKDGGHLIVFCRIGHNEGGVLELYPAQLEGLISASGKWQKKAHHEQDEGFLGIYKKLPGKRGILPIRPTPEGKRVCVVRYGAIGDGIIITPLLRQLKKDGYHITLNINPYCKEVFKHNPHVDNLLIQERESIPNAMLSGYWKYWELKYDKYINLSESLEGDLLMVEGRKEYFTSKTWRQKKASWNYYDYALHRAGYGPETFGQNGELFFTEAEERRAKRWFAELAKDGPRFIIQWALNGSSHHKVYPLMESVLREWFSRHPDSLAITTGDYMARLLEFEHPQLIEKAGTWLLRESLLATKYANLVIGPETGVTNASGCWDTPKIVLLSHSTKENMTKYFVNDFSLEPDVSLAPCWPCHQLHYTRESCPEGVILDTSSNEELGKAPICSISITPSKLLEQMEKIYQIWKV